jgi:methylmalonyl-CoA mutase
MAAALRAGFPQKRVASSASERIKAVTRRRDSIVGINQYANPKEKPLTRNASEDPIAFHKKRARQVAAHRESLDDQDSATVLKDLARVVEADGETLFPAILAAAKSGATLGELTRSLRIHDAAPEFITPVCLTRAAAPLEGLRAAMDRQPQRAKVFLCNMGSLKEFKARADFSRGFFSVGGFDVVSPAGFKTPQDAAAAFASSGARIAVICSTDDNYPTLVPALVPLLQAAVPGAISVLAGYPPEQVEALKKAGIDEFIHVRADVLETLRLLQLQLGIS